jgi:hypothetical protein
MNDGVVYTLMRYIKSISECIQLTPHLYYHSIMNDGVVYTLMRYIYMYLRKHSTNTPHLAMVMRISYDEMKRDHEAGDEDEG